MSSTLKNCYNDDDSIEIGVDEAGRGPMFGRVYAAAVVLPKDNSFDHSEMKDSKKFTSQKKMLKVADYIKKNAICWSVAFSTEQEIDTHNIRKATHLAMHKAIKDITTKLNLTKQNTHILVDGNDFTPFMFYENECLVSGKTTTIKQGDNKISSIAAASILAKIERDNYIVKLCDDEPELDNRYKLKKNKGYGTKQHLEGIQNYGISKYHRKTFGICKN